MIKHIIECFINFFNKITNSEQDTTSNDEPVSIFDFNKDSDDIENSENGINSEIDETVYQGDYGDCWLISGVLSMSYTETGADILKDSISLNSDGSVDVYFEQKDKTYTISAEELEKENEEAGSPTSDYSTGDDDMLAMELAIEELCADEEDLPYSIADGGNPYYVYKLFGADSVKVANKESSITEAFDYFEENSNDCAMTLGVTEESICGLTADHAYTVKSVNDEEVVLVDPWDTSEEITVDKESLLENSDNLSVVYAEF